jgi:DNA repair exonuclease SbcCD ATPase subunit
MRLLRLLLENYQGIQARTFDFGGRSAAIFGDNETGKTTVINAVTWLLFDKASTGEKGYTPKTYDKFGGYKHNLDHAAEAQFETDTGRLVTLRKCFHEVYKKKKGSPIQEFSGHTVDYFADGVPTKEKDYLDTVSGFCGGPEMMKMLTLPTYFAEDMSWQDRRKVLLDICGDVGDADVIAGNRELRELPQILTMPGTTDQRYAVEDYKRIASARKAEINRQLQTIPARVDEASRAMPDIHGLDRQVIEKEIADFRDRRDALTTGTHAPAKTEAQVKLAEAEARLAEAKANHLRRVNEANQETYTKIAEISKERATLLGKADDLWAKLREKTNEHDRMEKRRKALAVEYTEIHASQWDPDAAICPTCHRPLPEEDAERMREEFNVHRGVRLEEINATGCREASRDMLDKLLAEMQDTKTEIGRLSQEITERDKALSELQESVKQIPPFTSTAEYADLCGRIECLRKEAADDIRNAEAEALDSRRKLDDIDGQIRQRQGLLMNIENAAQQQRRVAELEEQEKRLAAEYEALEKGLYLCDLFTRTKVSMLTDRINAKFRHVRFQLVREQNNGGIDEDCEAMVPSADGELVAFKSANNAGRINAGIEIIGTLSEHYGISMPVFIDNAEAVTRIAKIPGQMIRLVVSEKDKVLRLVLDQYEEEGDDQREEVSA